MSRDKETTRRRDKKPRRRVPVSWSPLLFVFLSLSTGCQQKMARQPSYRPLDPSTLFPDGMSARPLPDSVVAREWPLSSDPVMTGLKPGFRNNPAPAGEKQQAAAVPPAAAPNDPAKFVATFPFGLNRADLDRGQERYTIFCAVCHDPVGTGNGKIPERGYVKPPNFHTDASRGFARYRKTVPLREVPVGYIFEVISRGYGAMPRYGPQVPPRARWRIAAYVRALQLSQQADLDLLPPEQQKAARAALGGQP